MKIEKVIEVDITDKEDIFNKFNKDQISDELANYIQNNSRKISMNGNVKIRIHTQGLLDTKEKARLLMAIRDYFESVVIEKGVYTKYNHNKQIILCILGVLLIVLSNLVGEFFKFVIPELLLIIGWFSIWEAVDNILFVDTKNKIQMKIAKKISKCDIEFD